MKLCLEFINEQSYYLIDETIETKLQQLLQLAGELEQVYAGEVALSFVDDEAIQYLNKQYRGLDKPTDVLSFAMLETADDELEINFNDLVEEENDSDRDVPAEPLGDIVISVPRAIAQAEEYGHSVERELCFLFVHGFLHLIGYDHNTAEEESAMFSQQELILQKAGVVR